MPGLSWVGSQTSCLTGSVCKVAYCDSEKMETPRSNPHERGGVALMSLRRESRRVQSHGTRLLTLCDNLAAVCSFDKGRARDLSLLALCRRAAAMVFSTGIQWRLMYVESARNPSDKGS